VGSPLADGMVDGIGKTVEKFSNTPLCRESERGSFLRARRPVRDGIDHFAHIVLVTTEILPLDKPVKTWDLKAGPSAPGF